MNKMQSRRPVARIDYRVTKCHKVFKAGRRGARLTFSEAKVSVKRSAESVSDLPRRNGFQLFLRLLLVHWRASVARLVLAVASNCRNSALWSDGALAAVKQALK